MFTKYIISIVLSWAAVSLNAQPTLAPKISQAKRTEKERLTVSINDALALPITQENSIAYESAFWAMMLLEQKPTNALTKLKEAIKNFKSFEEDFQNSVLEVIYSQYPKELEVEISSLVKDTAVTGKRLAVVTEYLIRINKKKYSTVLGNELRQRLMNKLSYKDSIYYNTAKKQLLNSSTDIAANKDFLKVFFRNTNILQGKNVVLSLQNKNRAYPGIVIILDTLRNIVQDNGNTFFVSQLARSITNLPYYISNGNTPQGVFRITGYGISKNSHIGPTENLQLCMPYECSTSTFFVNTTIPTQWQDSLFNQNNFHFVNAYPFFKESITAGKLGRFEIIAHGTTVNNEYYKGKTYYGYTPTMGCLQAKETWDYKTGIRTYSDQQKLVDAFKSTGAKDGYLIVLDIINENRAVTFNDVLPLLYIKL